jgi:hypothetical protein
MLFTGTVTVMNSSCAGSGTTPATGEGKDKPTPPSGWNDDDPNDSEHKKDPDDDD